MNWQAQRQLEREEEALAEELARGDITHAEFNRLMRDLQRDYQAAAEQAAEEAYREELDRW